MPVDGAYALTRRRGVAATVTRLLTTLANPETGDIADTVQTLNFRRVVKQPTAYHRIFRAQATRQDFGETSFIFWLKDVASYFTRLSQDDYITMNGVRYDVIATTVEETALVVMARETLANG